MSTTVQARRLIAALAEEEEIEVRRVDPVARGLAQLIERQGRPPSGAELEAWLEEHELVTEVYTEVETLDRLLQQCFPEAFAPRSARNEELEQALRDAPDDVAGYQIYADWLQERGDPLGQLMALAIAGDDEGFERHLARHKEHFLGGAARMLPDHLELEWRFGVVRALAAHAYWGAASWRELLQLPACRLLQRVELRLESQDDCQLLPVLAEHAPVGLRTVALRCFGASQVPLDEVLAMPELRELELIGAGILLPASTPERLERLCLRASQLGWGHEIERRRWSVRRLELGLGPGGMGSLSELEAPVLEQLTIHTVGLRGDFNLAKWLDTIDAPQLKTLGFVGRAPLEALREISRLPLGAALEALELRRAELGDEAIEVLASEGLFPGLTSVDVSDNELTEAGLSAARDLAPTVVDDGQQQAGTAWTARLRGFGALQIWDAEKVATNDWFWDGPFVDGDLIWGWYTGYQRYSLFLSRDLKRFGCTCEAEILPCEHVVALGLIAAKAELEDKPSGGIEARVGRQTPTLR